MSLVRTVSFAIVMGALFASGGWADNAVSFAVNPASRLSFVAVQAGSPFSGSFGAFDAKIVFGADALADSSFNVHVVLKSVDTDYPDRDEILRGREFFDVAVYPEATFVARQFIAREAGAFVASGVLTIKGVAQPLELPFTFSPSASVPGQWVLQGSAPVNRLDFGVGTGEWSDPKWLGHEVTVSFELLLNSGAR